MMNLAPFPAAPLRLEARLNEAETCAKPYRFAPRNLERLIELAMRESKSLGDGTSAETGETLTSRNEGLRP